MKERRLRIVLHIVLTAGFIGVLFLALWWANTHLGQFPLRVMRTGAVYIVAAVAYNLVNGITGQFSLGPNGFMALGGYTVALLMLPLPQKQFVWFLQPLMWPFNSFSFPWYLFGVALVLGGLVGALGAVLVGIPSFRLRGDYLAIATFGFGEIIFVLANNLIPLTNGPLGMKGIPEYASVYWCFGWAVVATLVVSNLAKSSYGRAMKAIRDDEIAAESMGVNVFRTKMLAFATSGFFGAVAGGLLVTLITTISPTLFTFNMTFNLLIIIVLGGLGSITGSVITAFGFAVLSELLRAVEAPINIGPIHLPGVAGMRMVVFSVLLILLMIFYRRGLFGQFELSWDWVLSRPGVIRSWVQAKPGATRGVRKWKRETKSS
ncbi:MAG: branched-chain amino acid ABC transporter permease [Bacillota bacterium]